MLDENRGLIEAGGAIVILRPKDKRPVDAKWTELPRLKWHEAKKIWPAGSNIGLRLGQPSCINGLYIHGVDVDIRSTLQRHIDEALAAFKRLFGSPESYDCVRSGSGGESFHAYFLCAVAFRTKMLVHSDEKVIGRDGKPHWAWEIELGGTGRQFVLPPSIHPITRKPYVWLQGPPDWDYMAVLSADELRKIMPVEALSTGKHYEDGLDQLRTLARDRPKWGFEKPEIEAILDTLVDNPSTYRQYVEDREGWYRVGMALHHQSGGTEWAYEMWCSMSALSDKFDEEDQWAKWKSFGKTSGSNNPITMLSLKRYAEDVAIGVSTGAIQPEVELEDDFHVRPTTAPCAPAGDGDAGPIPIDWHDTLWELCKRQDLARKRAARDAEDDRQAAWMRELDRTDTGSIRKGLHNMALILGNDTRMLGVLGYNEFIHEQVQRRPLKSEGITMFDMPQKDPVNGDPWTSNHDSLLRLWMARPPVGENPGYGMTPTDRDLKTAVVSAALVNRFHPVQDYFLSLKWDGVPRLASLFKRYLGCDDEPEYHSATATLMFLASVTRVFEPGHKFDHALILEGPEGLRKSTFIKTLAVRPEWFGELHGDFSDRNRMVEQMKGKTTIELPELSGLNKSGVNEAKAFMSEENDNVRLAYEHRSAEFPRQCVFWGSTNDRQYLLSDTGNRRFWPVFVRILIDTVALAREVPQLWAEAVALYFALRTKLPASTGPLPLYLEGQAAAASALKIQAERKVTAASDIYVGMIEHFVNTPDTIANITGNVAEKFSDTGAHYLRVRVCASTLHRDLPDLSSRPLADQRGLIGDLNTAMRKLGWTDCHLTFGEFGKQRGFKSPGVTDAELRHGYTHAPKKD